MIDNKEFTEKGFISSALNDVADIDIDAVRDAWQNNKPGSGSGADGAAHVLGAVGSKVVKPAGDAAEELDKFLTKNAKVDTRSIVARARNSICQFPIYVTQSLPVSAAQVLSQLFERVYADLVKTVISQKKIIDENEANNLVFLKQFHTNLKESGDLIVNPYYQPINEFDQMLQESVFYEEKITPNMTVKFRWVPASISDELIKESARLANEPLAGLTYLQEGMVSDIKNQRAEKDFQAKHDTETASETSVTTEPLKDDELMKIVCDRYHINYDAGKDDNDVGSKVTAIIPTDGNVATHIARLITSHSLGSNSKAAYRAALTKFRTEVKEGNVPNYVMDGAGRICRKKATSKSSVKTIARKATEVNKSPAVPVLLKDADIKKVNSMAPWTLEVSFHVRAAGRLDTEVHYIIGIKSIMHLIRTQDLADELRELVTGNIKTLKKVKYKTGEISFWDYMFNISGAKRDAAKLVNGNKRWINTLKKLAEFNKTHGSLFKGPVAGLNKGDVPIPNATLILSQPDITALNNQTGIDLSVAGNAHKLAKSLFLMAIAIVDSSAGTMRVMFPDTQSDWSVESLSSMEAEINKLDNNKLMKELNHLVNK